jgi:hypothetical protein
MHEDCKLAARHPTLVYICIALRGQFKNEVGVKWYHHPLVAVTKGQKSTSKFGFIAYCKFIRDVGFAADLYFGRCWSSKAARVSDLDIHFHHFLLWVQEERPDLIPANVDIKEEYSMKRSPHRGSTSQARNKQVLKDVVEVNQ